MALLVDLFGFLSVLLSGIARTVQSLALGSVVFTLFLLPGQEPQDMQKVITDLIGRFLRIFAIILLVTLGILFLLHFTVLYGSMSLPFFDSITDTYGIILIIRLFLIGFLVLIASKGRLSKWMLLLIFADLFCAGFTSHAAARIDQRAIAFIITIFHHLGAALWIGGLPAFLIAMQNSNQGTIADLGHRYSNLSIFSVGLLALTGIAMGIIYAGSLDAIYGTAYGLMMITKSILFASLLILGLGNFILIRKISKNPSLSHGRLRRFVEVELGIGIAIFFAAASITSLPPARDLTEGRVTIHELLERFTPKFPSLVSPDKNKLAIYEVQQKLDERAAATGTNTTSAYIPGSGIPAPRNAADIRWSEYNHHWAGIIILTIGLLAFWDKNRPSKWTRHWPLAFILLAIFLFFRSEAESWPLGNLPLTDSLRDPEFIQHKMIMALITGFALFEWAVRIGKARPWMKYVFPLACSIGGTLLLSHSHSLANIKDLLLIEYTHTPLAILGIWAGWARWLELRLPEPENRWAGWIWPLFFLGIGLTLLFYREI